jgi:acetyltransferase
VSLHNLLASGFAGGVYGTNLQGEEVLGVQTVADIAQLPDEPIDLVFVCTPASANPALLRACAAKGVKAAFLTSAGYGEAGEEGRRAERDLVALADELGILLAGPNGQGVVSTPASLCAQIVAPFPPAGHIGVASQSGNFVSSFLNYARQTGVGISRAVSAGNAAAVTPADYLDWYSNDAATAVSLAYVEGIVDGRGLLERFASVAARKPLVLVKGGATENGARAAASHTGALAANDKVFDGACRQAGVTRAATVEEAFEAAATFATQPLPKGPNTVILTTAGGWGVVTSDAIARESKLTLMELPADLLAQIDTKLPPRWSRNNPVDCAGGETRDTIPEVLEMIAAHPAVDAVIYLGLGIQSNQARLMREGRFYPDHGLERIVAYHERQDERFAEAAAALSEQYGKPILCATELAVADPENAGPRAVRASGRLCYASGNRAVTALGHLWDYARFRDRRGMH